MPTFREKLADTARRTPWWGLSLLVHAIVIFILMNWKINVRVREEIVTTVHIVSIRPPEPVRPPVDISTRVSPEPPAIEPPLERHTFKPLEDAPATAEAEKASARVVAVEGGPFAARTPGGRQAVVEGGGGATPGSENAVELGLLWLSRKQLATGGWRTDSEGARWADPGISGLATLAFLGAGYTHKRGKFLRVVDSALGYLKSQQDREGCIALTHEGKRPGGYMYCHAMATLALVEAFGMTQDLRLQEPAQRAIDFICKSQNSTGGWRYYHNSPDGDSSISGWMVMALRLATLVGLDVPPKALGEARRFFDSVTDRQEGKTFYLGRLPMGVALHAVGLLCQQYLGMAGDDPYIERAGAVINANPPKWVERDADMPIPLDKMALFTSTNNYYFWYYANLALHQRHGAAWEKWHPQVRDLLLRIQDRDGDKEGSWPPLTYGGSVGGRVYTTALAVLSLEVYYRYSPMYREKVDEVLAAYGDALAAYNHFARLADKATPEAREKRSAAIERLTRFLTLSESRPEPNPKSAEGTAQRRGQAALMLVRLHRAGDELHEAIALLKTFPDRFPGVVAPEELVRLLADLHRALAQKLADAGDAENAKKATAIALNLYYPVVIKALGKDPALELWLANGFYEREDWRKALDLYKPQVERVDLRRLDPKSEEGRIVVGVYDRLVKCCVSLRMYANASQYLEQLEKLVGASLDLLRQRADLHRLRKDYGGARRIYDTILRGVPEYSKEWWETKYDQLFMIYLDNRSDFVVKSILKLQISHPDLGGEALRPRFLDLLSRAQNGKPSGKALSESSPR